MSENGVSLVTELILRTAAARGELRTWSTDVLREVEKIGQEKITITPTYAAGDASPIRQLINELRGTTVDVAVRFVPQGVTSVPAITAAAAQAVSGGPSPLPPVQPPPMPGTAMATPPPAPPAPRQTIDLTRLPDFVREQVRGTFQQSERLGLTGDIEHRSAQGQTASTIARELIDKIPLGDVAPKDFVRQVRTAIGVPSQDERSEFQAWQQDYQRRTGSGSTATNTGAALALQNGSPGVDPIGFSGKRHPDVVEAANNAVDDTGLGETLSRFRVEMNGLADEAAKTAAALAQITGLGGQPSSPQTPTTPPPAATVPVSTPPATPAPTPSATPQPTVPTPGVPSPAPATPAPARPATPPPTPTPPPLPPGPRPATPPAPAPAAAPAAPTVQRPATPPQPTLPAVSLTQRQLAVANRTQQEIADRNALAASRQALRQGMMQGNLNPSLGGGGVASMPPTLTRRGQRLLRRAQRRSGRRGGGTGAGGGGGGAGGGGGHGGGRGGFSQYARLHPRIGQFLGAAGAIYGAQKFFDDAVGLGDAGYGQTANFANLSTMRRLDESVRSIPLAGGLVGGAVDFSTSVANYLGGSGFVSTKKQTDFILQQAQLQDEVGRRGISSNLERRIAKTYDPREAAQAQYDARLQSLQAELNDPTGKYRQTIPEGRGGGRRLGDLNAAGEQYSRQERAAAEATRNRAKEEYQRNLDSENVSALVGTKAANREAQAAFSSSIFNYSRQNELNDTLAKIDEGVEQKRADLSKISTKDPEYAAKKQQVDTEAAAAEYKKAEETSQAKRRWANEDAQIIAAAAAATTRATDNAYDADKANFKASWEAKINTEQDYGKRQLLIRQRDAEEAGKVSELSLQARQQTERVRNLEIRTGGAEHESQLYDIDDSAKEEGEKYGLFDREHNRWRDTDTEMDPATGKPFDQGQKDKANEIDRDKRAKQAEVRRQYRFGTEDIEFEADSDEARFRGNRYGAEQTQRDARTNRELNRNSGSTPEAAARRAAIYRRYQAEQDQAERDRDDEIRQNDLESKKSQLRIQGRGQAADIAQTKEDIAREVRDAAGDYDRLRSVIGKNRDRLEEQSLGNRRSEMFSGVAEYANNRFMSAANNDQGAYQELKDAAEELRKAAVNLNNGSQSSQDAAKTVERKFQIMG